ncbi:MAG TPA: endonuclease/exonuclease/phosphatase family protein [Alphaproteobacteria bacterium]|nr:endonuclease/exonuclease/phosphatase family protein [Alphaproteobacteria bacterium]
MQQTDFKFFRRLTTLGVVTLLAFSLTPYIPFSVSITDLPSHFVLQYAIGAVIGSFVVLLLKMPRLYLVLLGIAFALNMATLAPYLGKTPSPAAADMKTFKVLQVNTLYLNRNTERLEALIRAEEPDIITAVETNDAFAAMFKTLADIYPHQDIHPRSDARGLAVLSKFALQDIAVRIFDEPVTPAHTFTVSVEGQSIRFVSMHPFTPTRNLKRRDAHMFAIAKTYAAPQATPLVITGDFNATPWSPAMKTFMQQTGLKTARQGRGVLPTWPTFLPATFLRIPIDHILVSEHLRVIRHTLGGNTGSDHLPTIAVIGIHTP